MVELTQESVDGSALELRAMWAEQVRRSGKSQAVYIVTDTTGGAREFLALVQQIKEHVEEAGLVMPAIVDGVVVSYVES